jgi:hypothetical protein
MTNPKLYWTSLLVFCLLMVAGGVTDVLRLQMQVETFERLELPVYLLTIVGTAKLIGVVVIAVPSWPILKEWAYAGFSIDLVGATASHAFVGDPIFPTLLPLAVLAVGLASCFSRPPSRRLTSG